MNIFNKSPYYQITKVCVFTKLPINPKSPHNKMPSINMFPFKSTISATFYKLAFKSTLHRLNVKKKMFIKKKKLYVYIAHISNLIQNDFLKNNNKNNSVLTNGKVELLMIPQSDEICRWCQQSGMSMAFKTLLQSIVTGTTSTRAQNSAANTVYRRSEFVIPTYRCPILIINLHNFAGYVASVIQFYNVKLFFYLFIFFKKRKQTKNCIYHTDRQDIRNDVLVLQSED
ncbi:hypothetical protein RFI_32563 [Reticulomyxa filosa]|uniref:Uncharacterized protein n=1 Tax=Reticulomyxa filosa TaxID=46433 RepID=X6LSG6_RETFI|nr:hypothetical protein RFI_32563 [Reticulomyxa filosa]|eukprot:ETO04833.1 hypothetical protein RFI_32563 [Reticulomyxa filosa]